jgi:signal transduction histidine kinase
LTLMKAVADHVAIAMQRIRMMESLERHARTAEAANEAKSRFLANMSHELRTPMNAIIGFTRLVSRNADGLAPRQVDNLSKILLSAEHLLGLIDEILDLSRVDAGHVTLDIAPLDVADVLREVTESLEPLVDSPRVQLVLDTAPALPGLATDRDKLKRLLLNLARSAIKYTDDGSIVVRTEAADARLRIAVSDTGIGIAADELDKVFLEFHRAASAEARRRSGTGLGLAISQRLARALGGAITVESRLGNGTTFTLDLPLRRER